MIKQIVIDANGVVLQCSVGGYIPNGIDVEEIPDEVMDCPDMWIYSGGEYTVNPNYVAAAEEVGMSAEERIPQIIGQIDELSAAVELLIIDTL